jgi:MFS transporter, PPP family, 3-phenylpropionic acid transporter
VTAAATVSTRVPQSLRALFLATGTWTAAIAPFSAVILRSRGVDTATIGLLAAASAVAATVLVPVWGHLADVVVGRTYAFGIAVLIAAAASIALLLPLPVWLLAAILSSFAIFPAMFLALADSLAVDSLPVPDRQYGALRGLASLSYAVGVIVAGFVYDRAGYAAVPLVSLGWAGVLLLVLRRTPDRTRDPGVRALAAGHGGDAAAGRLGSVSRALAVQPLLLPVLVVFAVAYTGMLGAVLFLGIRIVELGGQPSDVALTFGIAAFAEIPGLVMAGWLVRHIGIRWLVLVTLVGLGLCTLSWGVLGTPDAINATRIVTGVCFGALTAARVVLVGRLLPDELQATGQTMLQAATFGLGTALGALIGGIVYGALGPTASFTLAGALVVTGGVGAWVVLRGSVGARGSTTMGSVPSVGSA